jgi:hypothetical protein
MDDEGGTVESCTYAEISCEASNFAEDLEGEMTQPRSQFTLPVRVHGLPARLHCHADARPPQCSTLRELVDDMDWAGAPVSLSMRREPSALSFAAHGSVVGDLRVRHSSALRAA